MMWAKEISEGPTWGPQPTRARLGCWCAQVGCAHLVHLPLMFIAPKILKYPEKTVLNFQGILRSFIFGHFFYCTGNSADR